MKGTAACFLVSLLFCFCNPKHITHLSDDRRVPDGFGRGKDSLLAASTSTDSLIHIYLTFDDGPDKGSAVINEQLSADSIPATVFVIGKNVLENDSSKWKFRQFQSNPFIELGNHSYSHAHKHYRLYYKDPSQVVRDFELNAESLHLQNKIARLPGRNTWRIDGRKRTDLEDDSTAADSLAHKGYRVFGWDIEWISDSDSSVAANVANRVIAQVEDMILHRRSFTPGHIVILCHDPVFGSEVNRLQLALFIHMIKGRRAYRFERLSNYPG